MTNKDPQDIQESVNRWRREAVSPGFSSVPDDWAVDIDPGIDAVVDIPIPIPDPDAPHLSDGDSLNLNSNQTSPHSSSLNSSEAEVCKRLLSSGGNNTSSTFQTTPGSPLLAASTSKPKTPSPDTFNAPLPATPVALDAKSKTEQIIAQIRANALAASASSQDETSDVLVYQELDDSSSSDDDDDAFMLIKFDNGKGKRFVLPHSFILYAQNIAHRIMILVSLHLRLKMMIPSALMRARPPIQLTPPSMTACPPHRHPLGHPPAHPPTPAVPVRATHLARLSANLLPLIITKGGRKRPIHSIYS